MELKRALRNKGMLLVILLSLLLAILNLYGSIQSDKQLSEVAQTRIKADINYYPPTAFEKYLGGNTFIPYNGIFYTIFPILAVLPFGTSLARDEKLRYTRNILVRQKKGRYLRAKYVAAFVSGAIAVVMPLIFSFLFTMTKYSCANPYQISYQSGLTDRNMFSQYYFTNPWVYMGLYLLINMAAGGMLSGMALLASHFLEKKMTVLFAPFIVYEGLQYALIEPKQSVYSLQNIINPKSYVSLVTPELTITMLSVGIVASFIAYYLFGMLRERIR